MNKTQFNNNFGKFFQHITQSDIVNITSNKKDTVQFELNKNNRHFFIDIQSHIQMCDEGILNFSYQLEKSKEKKPFDTIYDNVQNIHTINLYEAKDAFCKEQALEFQYDKNKAFYVLIYTDMVESSLEFFDEAMNAEKFERVAF